MPHHVGYAVADINKSLEQYKYMGYKQVSDICIDDSRNISIVFMKNKNNSVCIELIEPLNEKSPITETLIYKKNVASPYHICYETYSLKKSIYLLKRKGFVMTSNPSPAPALQGRNVAFLVNKDAGLIELLEKSADYE